MIIVDCTVLADLWTREAVALEAAKRLYRLDSVWVSISLWRFELGNVLLKYVRAGRLKETVLVDAYAATEKMVTTVEMVDHHAVGKVAQQFRLSYYDASYVWLAHSRRCPIYTRDGGILKAVPDLARAMPAEEE